MQISIAFLSWACCVTRGVSSKTTSRRRRQLSASIGPSKLTRSTRTLITSEISSKTRISVLHGLSQFLCRRGNGKKEQESWIADCEQTLKYVHVLCRLHRFSVSSLMLTGSIAFPLLCSQTVFMCQFGAYSSDQPFNSEVVLI